MDVLAKPLLNLCASYAVARNVKASAIAKAALRDHTFFRRIENGDNFTVKTFYRLVQWFADNWPDEQLDWPEDIARPPKSQAAA